MTLFYNMEIVPISVKFFIASTFSPTSFYFVSIPNSKIRLSIPQNYFRDSVFIYNNSTIALYTHKYSISPLHHLGNELQQFPRVIAHKLQPRRYRKPASPFRTRISRIRREMESIHRYLEYHRVERMFRRIPRHILSKGGARGRDARGDRVLGTESVQKEGKVFSVGVACNVTSRRFASRPNINQPTAPTLLSLSFFLLGAPSVKNAAPSCKNSTPKFRRWGSL